MKTVYLHIGTPKTGTTAIQYFCRKNNNLLQQLGFCYPDLGYRYPNKGRNRNAHFWFGKVYDENNTRDRKEEKRIRKEGMEKIQELLDQYPNIILSDEHFWNAPKMDSSAWMKLRKQIEKMGAVLKVIVYLRRQDQVVQSYWSQRVKEGLELSFEEYIRTGKYEYFQLDYEERLTMLAEVLEQENVIVRCYEKGQYKGKSKDICSDFLDIFGIEFTEEFAKNDTVRNLSLHSDYLEIRRIFNYEKSCKRDSNLSKILLKEQAEQWEENAFSFQKGTYFSKQSQAAFLEQYQNGNQMVAKVFLGRPDGILFYDEYRNTEQKLITYNIENLVQICGRIIERQEEEMTVLEEKNRLLEEQLNKGKIVKKVKRFYCYGKQKLRII